MITSGIRKLLFAGLLVAAVLLLTFGVVNQRAQPAQPGTVFSLQAPPFVNVARAEGAGPTTFDLSVCLETSDLGTCLDQEAGISAYYKSPDAITLSQVRPIFRTIELETPDFIIGSVPVPNHVEHFDAHVYVHRTGWILAYYLRADPVSKIIDVKASTVNTTKLKSVVSGVAGLAGAPFTDVTYYDFRYPNATNMLLVAEDFLNGNEFTIQLPSSFGYLERGWSLSPGVSYYNHYIVDDQTDPNMIYNGDNVAYGTLTASQLLPDVTHTIQVTAIYYGNTYGVLVIVYRVP